MLNVGFFIETKSLSVVLLRLSERGVKDFFHFFFGDARFREDFDQLGSPNILRQPHLLAGDDVIAQAEPNIVVDARQPGKRTESNQQ